MTQEKLRIERSLIALSETFKILIIIVKRISL